MIHILAFLIPIALGGASAQTPPREVRTMVKIALSSPAFKAGETIPQKHTCDGPDLSPELAWTAVPAGSKSVALLCEDPDAPGGLWAHWVIWGIPADSTALPGGIAKEKQLPSRIAQGMNDFRKVGYGGPCPPRGKPHRYFFRIYALDTHLTLAPGALRKDLLKAIEGHVIGEGELMGTYARKD